MPSLLKCVSAFGDQMPYCAVCVVFFCLQVKKMSSSSRALLFALALTLYVVEIASAETLCGGELVDALQFVCEDRGFYFSRFSNPLQVFHNGAARTPLRFFVCVPLLSLSASSLARTHLFG